MRKMKNEKYLKEIDVNILLSNNREYELCTAEILDSNDYFKVYFKEIEDYGKKFAIKTKFFYDDDIENINITNFLEGMKEKEIIIFLWKNKLSALTWNEKTLSKQISTIWYFDLEMTKIEIRCIIGRIYQLYVHPIALNEYLAKRRDLISKNFEENKKEIIKNMLNTY